MEFGFELVCDQVRSQIPLRYPVETRPRLVADRSEAGRKPASSCWRSEMIGQIPARCRSATSFGRVCDQDRVMEFGFERVCGWPTSLALVFTSLSFCLFPHFLF